jgi:hypothetical protein
MNSEDVQVKFGKRSDCWIPLDDGAATKSASARGVYVIRFADGLKVGRVRGESDIVYVGSGSIRTRLRAHADLRPDFKDKGWLLTWIGFEKPLQVCFFECADPAALEGDLLVQYLSAHQELPPANWRGPRLSGRQKETLREEMVRTYLNSLPPDQRNLVLKAVQDRAQPQKG